MRASELFFPTLREKPAEAELVSHQLLLRGGFINRVASGVYTFLPLGYRVIRKIEDIVREEMDRIGGQEVFLPALQPLELRELSQTVEIWGPELLKLRDRAERWFCLGPTHEEVITELVRTYVKSYKQLPLMLYQIQTKFRDEPRPRGGLMRAREFMMKDLYSFHLDEEGLDDCYKKVWHSYGRIFQRCGLVCRVVEAEAGPIGGEETKEFIAEAATGEDMVLFCSGCGYAAKPGVAGCGVVEKPEIAVEQKPVEKVFTPDRKTVAEVTAFLGVQAADLVKTLIYRADGEIIAVLIGGDRELNELKLCKLGGYERVEMADEDTIVEVTGAPLGFAGPVGLGDIKIISDYEVMNKVNFVSGANEGDYHLVNVNAGRDFAVSLVGDIKVVRAGDICAGCSGKLGEVHGIEVGHIFKLGTTYSNKLGAVVVDEGGRKRFMVMGCYGLGISRTMAAVVEVSHDEDGIIWPISIAPYEVMIILIDKLKADQLEAAERIYGDLQAVGVAVILDDRAEPAGVKFKDADLIGIPIQVVVGRKLNLYDKVEVKTRVKKVGVEVGVNEVVDRVKGLIADLQKELE